MKWHSETEERIEAVRRTFESLRLTEFAAIGITCILFPNVVNLFGLERTNYLDRADYWIDEKRYMVEVSGTEREDELRRWKGKRLA